MSTLKQRGLFLFLSLALIIIALLFVMQVQGASTFQPPEDALLAQLQREAGGTARISYHHETGKVRFFGTTPEQALTPDQAPAAASSPEASAAAFLKEYGLLFGLQDPQQELQLMTERSLEDGRSFTRYQQVYKGLPVVGGELIVQTNARGAVISANGEVLPGLALDTTPRLSALEAQDLAINQVAKTNGMEAGQLVSTKPVLSIYNAALLGGPGQRFDALVWQTEVTAVDSTLPVNEYVLVDAQMGAIALHFSQIHNVKNRIVHDNNNNPGLGLPGGGPVRSEGQAATGTADVDLAYDYAGDTYDFLMTEHGRDSLDDNGLTLLSTVRYCPDAISCPYQNAFWNGTQMVYGAGFSAADDVVGHELTHGMTNLTSNLFYFYQSGAINESLSDIWGEFVDQSNGAGNDGPAVKWKMGEDIPGIGAIRDMKNPPAFNDPDRILSPIYYCEESALQSQDGDSGGVHINSGVNNKAAYLMTDGDTFNGKTVTGMGISKVADLYYEAETNMLTSASDYNDLYDILIQASINLGFNASEQQEVKDAVDAVEMNQLPAECPAAEAPVCESGTPQNIFFDDIEAGGGNWVKGSNQGVNTWSVPMTSGNLFDSPYATSGVGNIHGFDQGAPIGGASDTFLAMKNDVSLPADAFMHFNHSFGFESDVPVALLVYDGGILEYSINGGTTWSDAGGLFTHNGYNGTLDGSGNPLGAADAFTADSYGYISSRLNLASLAGENARFRFRIGTDAAIYDYGWFIDDVRIYTCSDDTPTPTATATISGTSTATPTATATVSGTVTATPTTTATPDPGTGFRVYMPLISEGGTAQGPDVQPGFWRGFATEFYVGPGSQEVLAFSLDIEVDGCGDFKVTHEDTASIVNEQFAFLGPFSASGTFLTSTTAEGVAGFIDYDLPGCGPISGGPFNWSTEWEDGSQPTLRLSGTEGLIRVQPTQGTAVHFAITRPER